MTHLSSTWGRRSAAVLATTSLVVAGLGFTSPPANAHPAGDRATDAGATWLSNELDSGVLMGSFGAEIGPSIDAGLAFDAVGRSADATTVAVGIAPHLVTTANGEYGYARATEYDFTTGDLVQVGRYGNATAKAAAFASRIGLDPSTAYSDIDLIAQLEDLTSDTTGQIGDDSSFGNYTNTIGQAFAVEALTAAESPEADAATSALLVQQCAAGYFRFALDTAACSVTDEADLDATSLVVLSLVNSGIATPAVSEAVSDALAWLGAQQGADGSLGAGTDDGANANTTGLAGWAMAQAGQTGAAAKAAGWLRGVQVADLAPCATKLTAENGALAPKPEILASTRTAGAIPAGQRLSYAFATAQALPALAHVAAGTGALAVSAPATAVEKSTVTVTVAGLGAGEAGCVSFGSVAKPVTGTGSDLTVTFDLPAGAATHTFTLTTLAGTQTATTAATLAPLPAPAPAPTATPTPVPATPEVGELKASRVEKVKRNKFKLKVTCDDTEACEGKIVVRTAKKVSIGKARARKILVAKKSYSVAPGETEKVVLRVRKPARPVLDLGRIKVKAVQTAVDAEPAVTKFWLRNK